jgi:hypothetical protein
MRRTGFIMKAVADPFGGHCAVAACPVVDREVDLVWFLRNMFHNFRLLPGAGGQPAGLPKGGAGFSVTHGGICFTEWTGVILRCTYKPLPKGRAFLCGGKGMDALRGISRRFWPRPPFCPPAPR